MLSGDKFFNSTTTKEPGNRNDLEFIAFSKMLRAEDARQKRQKDDPAVKKILPLFNALLEHADKFVPLQDGLPSSEHPNTSTTSLFNEILGNPGFNLRQQEELLTAVYRNFLERDQTASRYFHYLLAAMSDNSKLIQSHDAHILLYDLYFISRKSKLDSGIEHRIWKFLLESTQEKLGLIIDIAKVHPNKRGVMLQFIAVMASLIDEPEAVINLYKQIKLKFQRNTFADCFPDVKAIAKFRILELLASSQDSRILTNNEKNTLKIFLNDKSVIRANPLLKLYNLMEKHAANASAEYRQARLLFENAINAKFAKKGEPNVSFQLSPLPNAPQPAKASRKPAGLRIQIIHTPPAFLYKPGSLRNAQRHTVHSQRTAATVQQSTEYIDNRPLSGAMGKM